MNDAEIRFFRETFLFNVRELQNFSLGQRAAQAGYCIDNADVSGQSRLSQRLCQHIIAEQNRHFIVVNLSNTGLSATFLALVHHIIVNQGRSVQQLERHGSSQGRFADFPQFFRQKQHQDGAHHLPFSTTHIVQHPAHEVFFVRQDTVEKLSIARQFFDNRLFDTVKFSHKLKQRPTSKASIRSLTAGCAVGDTDTSGIYATKVRKNKQSADYNAYF